jgi:hypothetical protein
MSEKALREWAGGHASTEFGKLYDILSAVATKAQVKADIKEARALSELGRGIALVGKPDLVYLLEYLRDRAADYKEREQPPHTSVSVSPVRRQELELLMDYIQNEFGVRLTDNNIDGWEYFEVEEG